MFLDFSKKNNVFFFGFSKFLVLENLEKKNNISFFFFLDFSVFIATSKNHNVFFGFSLVFIEKSKVCFLLDFQNFCFWNFLKIQKKL